MLWGKCFDGESGQAIIAVPLFCFNFIIIIRDISLESFTVRPSHGIKHT